MVKNPSLWYCMIVIAFVTLLNYSRSSFSNMSIISLTKLYDLLSAKVGKETAENLTSYIENKIKIEFQDNLNVLATREDLALLKGELKNDISNSRVETIKWMFIFWVGQVVATFGFILLFLKN